MTMLTRKEAAGYLRISERTMCELTKNREIAYHQRKSGGPMLFSQKDLDAYIDSLRVPTAAEHAAIVTLPGGKTFRKRRIIG